MCGFTTGSAHSPQKIRVRFGAGKPLSQIFLSYQVYHLPQSTVALADPAVVPLQKRGDVSVRYRQFCAQIIKPGVIDK